MRLQVLLLIFIFIKQPTQAQDSVYTRKIIKTLCSENFFGRGYVNKGLQKAEKFLIQEIKHAGAQALFGKSYTQSFTHYVNTFPGHCDVTINGKKLVPGVDFILDCHSQSAKGTCTLSTIGNKSYQSNSREQLHLMVQVKKKLTFSVAASQTNYCKIELDSSRFNEIPKTITCNVEAKLIPDFESKTLGCFVSGLQNDTMVVFSAHYDHLGGMGKSTFFAGANDNASGVSMVLNLMHYYTKHPPKYKTLFLFFAGEEAGILGSKFFVEQKSVDLKKIKFLINLDLLGTGDDGIMVVNGAVHQNAFEILKQINENKQYLKEIKKRGKAANSDHYWFTEAGVPCFYIYTLGGISAYHDVFDIEKTLPLSRYKEVFHLITEFTAGL